jgi:glycosyltransferase involved in cell wall biosynthesis
MYSSPNKLFDFAMGGLALAVNDLPFLKRVIMEHSMGRVFSRNEPEGIAETLNNMIADTEKLREYKHNARKAAEEHFYWEKQFTNYPWHP